MSLVTTPASALAVCATCSGRSVTCLEMTLTDGSAVEFTSCHSCETRSWKQGDRTLDLATVLGKARRHRP